ncbi:MAG: hypothetical protein KBT04_02330, partial [Bacteroidales bacterium]|nr:hypothetical protein [Candidatus Colimorpha onthohippi]
DVTYGPTSAPSGAGRIMEVTASKSNPNVIEREHNSVWYKFKAPYNGELEIEVTQVNGADDYDMMVYRYTDAYFSNNLIQGKIKPIASNLSAVDSSLIVKTTDTKGKKGKTSTATQATPKTAKGKNAPAKEVKAIYHIGMKHDATSYFLPKDSIRRDIKSVTVAAGETYYILLDNANAGSGHSIKVSMYVNAFTPLVNFIDPTTKKATPVDLLVIEKNTNNRTVAKDANYKGGRLSFIPNFNYTLYAKKPGFFSIYKDFNANIFKEDTMMTFTLQKAAKGSVFTIEDIYFTEDGKQLLGNSDTVLTNYVMLFMNHPEVSFLIKGYVPTYGEVTMESDQAVSLERAMTVKQFFMSKGIDASRMTVAGMTPSEIKKAGAAANDPKVGLLTKRVELIITTAAK